MFNLFGWIPLTIRNHPVITWIVWSTALATVSTIITSEVLNNTTLAELKVRNEGLTSDIAYLREENRTAQSRYDAAQASREETISKRVAEGRPMLTDPVIDWQARTEQQRQSLISAASETMAPWEREANAGILDDDDKVSLIEWTKYAKALRKLDISTVKDEAGYKRIVWPVNPDGN